MGFIRLILLLSFLYLSVLSNYSCKKSGDNIKEQSTETIKQSTEKGSVSEDLTKLPSVLFDILIRHKKAYEKEDIDSILSFFADISPFKSQGKEFYQDLFERYDDWKLDLIGMEMKSFSQDYAETEVTINIEARSKNPKLPPLKGEALHIVEFTKENNKWKIYSSTY